MACGVWHLGKRSHLLPEAICHHLIRGHLLYLPTQPLSAPSATRCCHRHLFARPGAPPHTSLPAFTQLPVWIKVISSCGDSGEMQRLDVLGHPPWSSVRQRWFIRCKAYPCLPSTPAAGFGALRCRWWWSWGPFWCYGRPARWRREIEPRWFGRCLARCLGSSCLVADI